MQPRIVVGVALPALLAVLAAAPMTRADEPKDLVAVLVARTDVPSFEPLKEPEKWFKVVHYLKGEEPRDAVTDFEQVKGRYLGSHLRGDQPLRKSDIGKFSPGIIAGPAPEGERAVAIKIDQKSVGDTLLGKRVDVYATLKEDGKDPVTEMIGKNLFILAIDMQKDRAECTATFAVELEQAMKLAIGMKGKEIHIKVCEAEKDKPVGQSGVPLQMPKGTRAAAVKHNAEEPEGGFILPGTRVDVIVTTEKPNKRAISETVLENALVLAVDVESKREDAPSAPKSTVTLAVPTEKVEKFASAISSGTVRLVLRPTDVDKAK